VSGGIDPLILKLGSR